MFTYSIRDGEGENRVYRISDEPLSRNRSPFRGSRRLSLLFRPVTQDYVVHNIAAADTSPAIKIIALAIKPFVIHETAARCALHGWSPPLRRFFPAKGFFSQNNNHSFWKSNLFNVGEGKFLERVLAHCCSMGHITVQAERCLFRNRVQ